MSKYEWEEGSVKLPATEYVKVRNSLIAAHNELMDEQYAEAERIYARVKELSKGKRKFNFINAVDRLSSDYSINYKLFSPKQALQTPKKKDFAKATTATKEFDVGGEATITLNPKTNEMYWVVPENNHAVDTAREHVLGRAFFIALSRVKWTNRTGGKFVGNDEYNQDDTYEGGGGNYVTKRFGNECRDNKY